MKKLNVEEASKTGIIKNGRTTRVRGGLMELQIGEAIIVEKGIDWISKTPPYRIVNYYSKQTNRKFVSGLTTDKKGWIIKRIS
jgi:hypothetical protein